MVDLRINDLSLLTLYVKNSNLLQSVSTINAAKTAESHFGKSVKEIQEHWRPHVNGSHTYKWLQFIADLYAASELSSGFKEVAKGFSDNAASIYTFSSPQNRDTPLRKIIEDYQKVAAQEFAELKQQPAESTKDNGKAMHGGVVIDESTKDTDERV